MEIPRTADGRQSYRNDISRMSSEQLMREIDRQFDCMLDSVRSRQPIATWALDICVREYMGRFHRRGRYRPGSRGY